MNPVGIPSIPSPGDPGGGPGFGEVPLRLGTRCAKWDDAELNAFFSRKAGVGLNRGDMFGRPGRGWMRLNFATSPELLEAAVARIESSLGGRRP